MNQPINAIGHLVAQTTGVPLLRMAIPDTPVPTKAARARLIALGRKIETLRGQGMKMVDIARQLNHTSGYVRGAYSEYRKALRATTGKS